MNRRGAPALLLCGAVLFPAGLIAQDATSSTAQHGAFAFAGEDGRRLRSTAEIENPEALMTALCQGNRRVSVRFERRQPAGTFFLVLGATVETGTTCFVASDALLSESTVIALERSPESARCSRELYPQFQAASGRPVVACWPIAESARGTRIVLIEFARRLKDALASLVVIDQSRRVYVNFAAEFTGPGADLWRVDDGGEIHPQGFEIVFLLRRGNGFLLATSWRGAEGASLSLWSADDSDEFRSVVTDSWYRAPR